MTVEERVDQIPSPPVFTRVLSTPPGTPWDQARVARLEAHRAAPVAIESLTLKLNRLAPWRNGKPGTFVAFYVKTEALGGGFRVSKVIDGRPLAVDFKSRAQAKAEVRQLAILAGAAGAATLTILAATITAMTIRYDAEQRLDDLVRRSTYQLRQAQVASATKRQNSALQRASNNGKPVGDVLEGLAWMSRMRRPDVPVEGFHWRPAGYGVEVRGEAQPFNGPGAIRVPRPLKPGVWLWVRARGSGSRSETGDMWP